MGLDPRNMGSQWICQYIGFGSQDAILQNNIKRSAKKLTFQIEGVTACLVTCGCGYDGMFLRDLENNSGEMLMDI